MSRTKTGFAGKTGPLLPVVVFYVASLAFLSASRLALVLWQWDRVAAVDGLAGVFINGLRMDLQIVGFATLPLLLGALFFASPRSSKTWLRIQAAWMILWFAVFIYMECATPSFINYYDIRPNRFFVEYLGNIREVSRTLWADYKLQMLGGIIAVALGILLFYRLFKHACQIATPWSWPKRLIIIPLCLVVVGLGARGSLDHRPANPGSAAFSSDHLVNDLAVSSTYNVLYAIYSLRHEGDASKTYTEKMADAEVYRRMHNMMLLPEAAFNDPAAPTMHTVPPAGNFKGPKNLVIILEESLGAQYVAGLGGKPYTPELDKLATQGIWFDHLYATGTRSVRGIEAVVTGFLPTPGRSVVKLGMSQQNFFTLADLFRQIGYNTSFIYGGESQFDNMRGFFLSNGFERVIDEKDYADPVFRGTWGISDEDLFNRAHAEFSGATKPFFALVFTSSNHPPHEYPAGRIEPLDGENVKVANAVRYADYALGRFFEQARDSAYWKDTVFLVVADHDDVQAGTDLVPIEHFHIPGAILGGGIAPRKVPLVASQIDLGPTLLSLMGIEAQDPMPGVDLLNPPEHYTGRAILQYGMIHALLRDNQVAIMQPAKPGVVYEYSGGRFSPNTISNPELLRDAVATAYWPSLAYQKRAYHPGSVSPHQLTSQVTVGLLRN